MSADEAIKILSFYPNAVQASLHRARGLEHQISLEGQELAKLLLTHPRMLDWITKLASASLFINGTAGNDDSPDVEAAFTFGSSTGRSLTNPPMLLSIVFKSYNLEASGDLLLTKELVVSLISRWPSESMTVLYYFS